MAVKQWFVLCGIFSAVMFFTGCSDVIKVRGKVTYSDGTPVTHGCVTFESGHEVALGMLDEAGNYRLGRFKDGDGIKPGSYSVWLTGTNITEAQAPEAIRGGFNTTTSSITTATVHKKFTSKATSDLTFEAKPGGQKTFDFVVEKPDPADTTKIM